MKELFGTDGIRGKAGVFPLDHETIGKIGASLGRLLKEKLGHDARLIVGRDTRESGAWIERAFCSGARNAGADCQSADVITTPGIAFLTRKLGFDAGIVISASHNPFEDNGIKIFSPSGKKLDGESEKRIEKDIADNEKIETGKVFEEFDSSKAAEFHREYLAYLASEFSELTLSGFKMVIDCANGSSSSFAPRLFRKFGAETVIINDSPDGRNINKDCGSLHLDHLQRKVLDANANFGVAFDGDADRSLFVDENGELVDGDAVLWIMAQHFGAIGQLKNDLIVATVMSNIGLEIALDSRNIRLIRTPVGDKFVLQQLLKSDASVGGEQSGHIIFPSKSLVGDGMFTTLYLLEALMANGKTLSEMTAGFKKFPQILINVKVREKIPFEDVGDIMDQARAIEMELGNKGRLLLRYSGTENLARVMIEGESQEIIGQQAERLAGVIEKFLG